MPEELKMPMPKLPEIEIDESFETGEAEPIEIEGEEESGPVTSEQMTEAIASTIGFICALGLPEQVFEEKVAFYKQAAINTGFASSLVTVIEAYMPQLSNRPEAALIISGIAFASIVIMDRKMTMKQYAPKKKKKKNHLEVKKKIEEARKKQMEEEQAGIKRVIEEVKNEGVVSNDSGYD